MKEVKAYVRMDYVQKVVWALEEKEFTAMTVIDVSALGHLADTKQSKLSIEFADKYSKMVKI